MKPFHFILTVSFLILIFIAPLTELNAQKISISNKQRLTNKMPKFKLLGKLGDTYLVDRYGGYNHTIDAYNNQLKLTQSKSLNLDKNDWVERIWIQPERGFVLTSTADKSFSVIQVAQLDERLNLSDKKMVLDTIYERRDILLNNYRTELSLNESHLMTYYPIFDGGDLIELHVKVYDHLFQEVQSVQFKDIKDGYNLTDIELFNDGSVVVLLHETLNNDEVYQDFEIRYSPVGGATVNYDYNAPEKIFRKPELVLDNLFGQLVLSGFYLAEKERKNEDNGAYKFFNVKIDVSTGNVLQNAQATFSDAFMTDLTGRPGNGTDINNLYTFYINQIIPKVDGGTLVVAESFYKEQESNLANSVGFGTPGFATYAPTLIYYYNDLIVFDIDENGDFLDVQIVRKRQVSENDNGAYSSFLVFNEQDAVNFLFLDEVFVQGNLAQFPYQAGEPNTSYSLLNIREKDVFPIVKMGVQTALNEIVIPSFSQNHINLIKIVYPL